MKNPTWEIRQGDALEELRKIRPGSVDLIVTDPPYLLSNGGTTNRGGKRVAVDKGAWDASRGIAVDWEWHRKWLHLCRHLLSPTGTLWVSGTHHAILQIGFAACYQGYQPINLVTWAKPNPPPNIACNTFTHSTEHLLWLRPRRGARYRFNYKAIREANGGKQLRDLWEIAPPSKAERAAGGRHPTQKPLALLDRIMLACAFKGALVVDPFAGSATTGVAALRAGARFIGIELDRRFARAARQRLGNEVRRG